MQLRKQWIKNHIPFASTLNGKHELFMDLWQTFTFKKPVFLTVFKSVIWNGITDADAVHVL